MKHLFLGLMALALGAFAAGCSSDEKEPGGNQSGELSIEFFRPSPDRIAPGSESILSWKTHNASSIRIFDQKNAKAGESTQNEGSITVKPEETTTYRLVAQNSSGASKEQTLQVIVAEEMGPEVNFGATKTNMDFGASTFLRWDTKGAKRVVISEAGGGQVVVDTDRSSDEKLLSGDKEVFPDRTIVYELVATDEAANTTTKSVEIVVDPVVTSFGSPEIDRPIPIGTDVKLVWTTRGAEELEITTPEGERYVAKDTERNAGEATLKAGESGTFTLTATRGKGQKIQEYKAQMREYPVIETYQVAPGAINAGQPTQVTVSWKVSNADSVRIDADDGSTIVASTPDLEGTKVFTATATMKLTITASNPAGDSTAQTTVLAVSRPEIVSFIANPNRVVPGATVNFSWSTTGASSLELEQTDDFGEVTVHPIGSAADGSKDVQVSVRSTFKLTARNLANATVTESVNVEIGPPVVDEFEASKTRYANTDPIVLTWSGRGGRSAKVYAIDGRAGNGAPINPVLVPGCDVEFPDVVSTGTCTVGAKATYGRYQFQIVLEDGTFKDEEFVTALVSDGPLIEKFEASRTLVDVNDSFELIWLVQRDAAGNVPELSLKVNGEDKDLPELASKPEDGRATVQFAAAGVKHFELTATSNSGATFADVATFDVTVAGTPTIDTFTVTPATIMDGESVTFAWTTTNVTRASIVEVATGGSIHTIPANKLADGTFPAWPTGAPTLTFRLQAYNARNVQVTKDVTVTITQPTAQILDFTVPATATAGVPFDLSWNTAGGSGVVLTPFAGPATLLSGAPFFDISATGTPVAMSYCGSGWSMNPLDDGCATINFQNGFTFPFDGAVKTALDVYVDGFISFDVGAELGDLMHFDFPDDPGVNLAPFWDGLTANAGAVAGPGSIYYEHAPGGEYLIIQWSHLRNDPMGFDWTSPTDSVDLNFQVILFANGAVDFRYGNMSAQEQSERDGLYAVIGYQDTSADDYDMLSEYYQSIPLANRSWRYFEKAEATSGTIQVAIDKTTTFTLCLDGPSGRICQDATVTVP